MPTPPLPLNGSCRCGRTHIRITKPPLMTAACHCRGCQKMSSSAYSLTVLVPLDGFEVTQGEPVECGTHGPDQDHMACPHCMSWMFTRITGVDAFLNVRPTMFDETSWFVPYIETMTSAKLPWVTTPARHSYSEWPPMDRFEELMAEYMAQA
ncbi:GFA family protein [Mameliella sediminis]|uniref:GFA family protein n=1 Tax=Mameliella sediminis TaxID=2836866 RepID=UPI001C469097|nr:GFA family protein [Mameliella sediminis]MBV7394992.1 GFA family protein [Mameliella sediminis]MBY6113695.1 GFA family protein [Antarctobacter heliothermus]MBY6142957.1 GFA family protein [Mameliella alba]MCA0953318.1 GFA family protein [Mameliella alba]